MNARWEQAIDERVDRRFETMVAIRRHLHAYPEPSGAEHETTRYLNGVLVELGLRTVPGPNGCGLIVDAADLPRGPTIALRADLDALRIDEQSAAQYASRQPGLMHACGHDAHTAIVMGAIHALVDAAHEQALPWPVSWRGIFQPAEETLVGAQAMVGAGALEGVSAILAVHVDPTRPIGRIGLRSGVLTANCDGLSIRILGRGGHAARPHETKDPIATAAQLISTLYLFVPRSIDSQDAVVVSIGRIAGGQNANVIPESVELGGTIRTLDRRVREQTQAHIRQLVRGLAEASGTQIDVEFHAGIHSVRNDTGLTELLRSVASDLLGADAVDDIGRPSMGSEDFASYLDYVPGAMLRLGCTSSDRGGSALHTPTFDIDERAIGIGAKLLARSAILWSDPRRLG